MTDTFDVYADAFLITLTPFGANLSFEAREAHPSSHAPQASIRLGTVRMSVEHLKVMVMMIRNQVKAVESQSGIKFEVPTNILAQLQIAPEDWNAFWK